MTQLEQARHDYLEKFAEQTKEKAHELLRDGKVQTEQALLNLGDLSHYKKEHGLNDNYTAAVNMVALYDGDVK